MKTLKTPIFSFIFAICLLFSWIAPSFAQDGFGQALGGRKKRGQSQVQSFGEASKNQQGQEIDDMGIGGLPTIGPGEGSAIYYNIHVLGEVEKPGTYKAVPSNRVADAIKYAGGFLDTASQRYVQLRRNKKTRYLDIYLYQTEGHLAQNPYLLENDVVFVPLKRAEFQIVGPVRRPGKYEISRSISLQRAIRLAGGFTTGRSLKKSIKIIRYDKTEKKQLIDIVNDSRKIKHFKIKPGDIIVVPHLLIADNKFDYTVDRIPGDNIFYPTVDSNVYVIGAVAQPGAYPFKPHLKAQEYVYMAGITKEGSKRYKLLKKNGKKIRYKKGMQLNPGDTIVVPTKAVTVGKTLAWFGSISSVILTTFVLIDRFSD